MGNTGPKGRNGQLARKNSLPNWIVADYSFASPVLRCLLPGSKTGSWRESAGVGGELAGVGGELAGVGGSRRGVGGELAESWRLKPGLYKQCLPPQTEEFRGNIMS
ncbi:hypothetical protein QUB63_29395 [Microcoleus sp. ARI1-B5]|uniref:hypothetical protein n=1 Tax=Microcoleus sp. ARI1-A2 TaxID=2818557 RepID=UPI002FD300C1